MKKRRAFLLCVLLFVLMLFAIGCDSNSDDRKDDVLGDYEVKIDSCYKEKHYYKGYVLVIKYQFTNNSDKPTSFSMAIEDTVYQDGIELSEQILWNTDVGTEIKPGVTIDVEVGYELRDTTTDVEVELTEGSIFSNSSDSILKIFSIKDLD